MRSGCAGSGMHWGSEGAMKEFWQATLENIGLILFVVLVAGPILIWQHKVINRD